MTLNQPQHKGGAFKGLAFEHGSGDTFRGDRLGILAGSILSALMAYALLHLSLPKKS